MAFNTSPDVKSIFKVRSEVKDYGVLVTALSKETQDHLFLKLLVCIVNDKLGHDLFGATNCGRQP